MLALAGIVAVFLAGAAFWAGRRTIRTPKSASVTPVERIRVSFQRGNALYARFTPDAQTVVYSAAWGDRPAEIFMARVGSPESRPLGILNANVLSISSRGELAILLKKTNLYGTVGAGTLARVPLTGGAPRQILEDVIAADWAPDGTELAVLRRVAGNQQVEYPIGKILLTAAPGPVHEMVRISPDGRLVATIDHSEGGILVVDRAGVRKDLCGGYGYVDSFAWHPAGKEVWFAGVSKEGVQGVFAVDLSGAVRLISESTDLEAIHDIARDGEVLMEREINTRELLVGSEGQQAERNLSWLDQSSVGCLSEDGNVLLFDEGGDGGGDNGSVYLRATDGSPPVRLADGQALDLSPDGKWALVRDFRKQTLAVVPTAIGEARPLSLEGFQVGGGLFLPPDGRRIGFTAREKDGTIGDYVVDVEGGKPRKFVNERITGGAALSPDGKSFAGMGPGGEPKIYSIDGGDPRPIPGLDPGDIPVQWSADGKTLYVTREGEIPKPVFRYDLATGKKALWKEIVPADRTGLVRIETLFVTRDGKHYAYSFNRVTASDLYVVRGWK